MCCRCGRWCSDLLAHRWQSWFAALTFTQKAWVQSLALTVETSQIYIHLQCQLSAACNIYNVAWYLIKINHAEVQCRHFVLSVVGLPVKSKATPEGKGQRKTDKYNTSLLQISSILFTEIYQDYAYKYSFLAHDILIY